uniref:M20_dimer domain-containing protein n=1 Tax=Angiostrongylus cantonensis TaxID=6313 RepID=A0A0K0D6J2_ANGCA
LCSAKQQFSCTVQQSVINSVLSFREQQRSLLKTDSSKRLGDVTTVNITKINGGVQVNVLPEQFIMSLDIRVTPSTDFSEMEAAIASWCKNAGPGVTFKYVQVSEDRILKGPVVLPKAKSEINAVTPTTNDDPFWSAFERSLQKDYPFRKCIFDKEIFSGATDSRFVREKSEINAVTPTTNDDPFWSAFERSLQKDYPFRKCIFDKEIFSGATDSRFVREV